MGGDSQTLNWKSFTKVTLSIAVCCNGSYDDLVASVMESRDLDYKRSDVVISYVMNSREKMHPTIINNDRRVYLYMIVEFITTPPQLPSVDGDSVKYENNSDHSTNIEDDSMDMKYDLLDLEGNSYDMITINIVESLNSMLTDERENPVLYIFNLITKNFGEKFRERGVTAKVNLLEKYCFYRKYYLVKLSCELPMAALRSKYGDGEGHGNSIYKYSSPIYKIETYLFSYSEAINIVPLESEWIML
ncbi:hypothetical protein BC332_20911 [Capsicum chinense]|nr:hypothetical protein BC332_20911 [Capsicum chinense]